ncbi:hypothetical protein ACHAWF_012385, partial [Thalassiosira exigua]
AASTPPTTSARPRSKATSSSRTGVWSSSSSPSSSRPTSLSLWPPSTRWLSASSTHASSSASAPSSSTTRNGMRPLLLERSSGSDMVLDYHTVSTQHAKICFKKGEFLSDAGSSNGSYICLRLPVELISSQSVQFLQYRLRFSPASISSQFKLSCSTSLCRPTLKSKHHAPLRTTKRKITTEINTERHKFSSG